MGILLFVCVPAVLRHNCNNFSDEAVTFLMGTGMLTPYI